MENNAYNEVMDPSFEAKIKYCQDKFAEMRLEISKTVIGQHDVVNGLIEALIANGHTLVEGIPGIGKTLLVRTLAKVTGCAFSRAWWTAKTCRSTSRARRCRTRR